MGWWHPRVGGRIEGWSGPVPKLGFWEGMDPLVEGYPGRWGSERQIHHEEGGQ